MTSTKETCWKCNGSGKFYSNRRFSTDASGNRVYEADICYPCKGKGYQTAADTKRTNYYYRHIFRPHI